MATWVTMGRKANNTETKGIMHKRLCEEPTAQGRSKGPWGWHKNTTRHNTEGGKGKVKVGILHSGKANVKASKRCGKNQGSHSRRGTR